MTRRVLLGVLEAFFRRPLLYLIPLIVLMAVGLYSGLNAEKNYRSVGTLDSSTGTVLSDIASTNRAFGFETPAEATSRNLNQRMRTGEFVNKVIDAAGLRSAVDQGLITTAEVRQSVSVYPEGDNLLAVAATTSSREQSQRLATAAIGEFLAYVIENDNADRVIAIEHYETQVATRQQALDEANTAYEQYMLAHPIADEDDRQFVERLQIQRLEREVEQTTEQFQSAETSLDDARMQASVAETIIKRQLRPVDAPELPASPEAGLRKAALTFGVFTMLGLVMSLVFLVVSAFFDRTIRESGDVNDRFGLDVIAVIPAARRR